MDAVQQAVSDPTERPTSPPGVTRCHRPAARRDVLCGFLLCANISGTPRLGELSGEVATTTFFHQNRYVDCRWAPPPRGQGHSVAPLGTWALWGPLVNPVGTRTWWCACVTSLGMGA